MPENTFTIRALAPDDRLNKFEMAHKQDALRAFLKKLSSKFHVGNIAKTYVAVETLDGAPPMIRSYITVMLSEIKKEYADTEDCPEARRYNYPAVKIARLATDRRYENRGLGTSLIQFAAGLVRANVMPHAGCRFLILDANPEKIDYYRRRGFTLVNNEENLRSPNPVMFMDLHKIAPASEA